ncbi:putative LaeA-like methyltransferase [Aspergillus clavatus NRRL 1]|uniref:LaeA-like methyltransferase, putative n=1 Tax=Aspergillus clavatus (strain ATCC 1007 / CBS 513.65 / DSM 816 / NCTC 3887 / NRRL 1 / QM 1276 / 107) TaxID=344612 RepID=A1CEM6_ASPCL|nr:LaeA-like methyltransferase, putative [Aspergillus clavatus NRRL 1]EAW11325.1 LaeA-like methyltransferase, putative [Aspergillus clavatus NRRL 1]
MGSPDEAYLLSRDAEESKRLNAQHVFLVDVIGGTPIHPSIPTENIQTIADAGTGTGIWLVDVATTLNKLHPQRETKLDLHGFDISPAQFPFTKLREPRHEIRLSVQDITCPFPKEYHNRFDLVHVRLLAGAMKEADYPATVRNLYNILKPGGHLQWDDCDTTAFTTTNPTPTALEMARVVVDAVHKLGLCASAPQLVHALAQQTGFVDTRLYPHSTANRPRLHAPARAWLMQACRALMPHAMVKSGEAGDEKWAVARAERLVAEFGEQCAGSVPLVNLYAVVARKPGGKEEPGAWTWGCGCAIM